MGNITIAKVALSLTLKVGETILKRHLVSSPGVMGKVLASEIDTYVREHNIGYYPAIDYFRDKPGIDADLLKVIEETGWIVCKIARELLVSDLKPAFSHIQIQSIKPVAFTLPSIRLNQNDACDQLAHHLTVNNVKVGMIASSIEKISQTDDIEKLAERKIWRWLQDDFESIKVVSARLTREET